MTQAVQKVGKPFKRILLTGAAGGLGKVLRDRIKPWADVVRLSDVVEMGEAREGEDRADDPVGDGHGRASAPPAATGVPASMRLRSSVLPSTRTRRSSTPSTLWRTASTCWSSSMDSACR